MIQSKIGHIQFNVKLQNLAFYKDLMTFLGWSLLYQDEDACGYGNTDGVSLWFVAEMKDVCNDYDGSGMNHLALSTSSQREVDEMVAYLRDHAIAALFDTPRHRPEFSREDNTYYQVMFESPDRILFEVVYRGPKSS